jgi:valyl-tRNA synthetase
MLDKTFDPKTTEPRLYETWESAGAFSPDRALAKNPDAQPYCIVIPPPNVTGSLHIGHALNNTLQDVLARYRRMRGDAVLWLPGTDHAGIATQMVVERQLAAQGNEGRRELGRERFVEKVWEWKAQSGGTITQQLRRLGASCDWSRERFTLDDGLSAAVRRVFVTLHQQGLIYRDKRLVNWDPQFQTAISDLEVETREVAGKMWHFAYPLEGEPIDGVSEIVIATTRPETMLGDGAVAVHPDDERYKKFVGRMVRLPIADRLIPIIADEYPDPEKGSGAVKITGAHDFNDYQVARRHGLEMMPLMDEQARMVGQWVPARFQGMDRYVARKAVVDEIEGLGLLREIEEKVIAQPFGDRSGVVIEPFLTDQWYVDAKTLAQPAIAAVENGDTVFTPRNWEKTYFEWMRNIEPWCISRQLWWGHRIPAWYGPTLEESGEGNSLRSQIFVAETALDAIEQARAFYGPGVEVTVEEHGTFGARTAGKLTKVTLQQDQDVLDTWFSSGLWPFSTMGWPEETDDFKRFYPTSDLVTGFDIIFFWVARMMMMGLHFTGEVPFKRIFINALVRDSKGQKMSKSKGNVIDPLELVDAYGADALRFTMTAMSGQGRDIKLSTQRVEGYRNFHTKLWNAARFCQMNECVLPEGFDPGAAHETLNRWVRGEVVKTRNEVTAALDAFAFDDVANALYRFIWNVFCDWYLELAKPILNGSDEAAKAETRAMAAWVLDQAMMLLHPVAPFVTEALWEASAEFGQPRAGFLMEAEWPSHPAAWIEAEAAAEIDWLIELVSEIRSIRAEMNVPPSARPPLTLIGADGTTQGRLTRQKERLAALGRLGEVKLAEAPPAGAAPFTLGEATGALSIAEFIDLNAEKARLTKAIAEFEANAKRARSKLDNAAFMAKAAEPVIAENREKLAEAEAGMAKLQAALGRLAAMG